MSGLFLGWFVFVVFCVVLIAGLIKVLNSNLEDGERLFGFACCVVAFIMLLPFSTSLMKSEYSLLRENIVYTLPDGNKIKIVQEGKNSVIMPANEVVKEK